ncbi:MAG: hypothetical protein RSD70_04475, partial [Acidaminococcaceae bacterium]
IGLINHVKIRFAVFGRHNGSVSQQIIKHKILLQFCKCYKVTTLADTFAVKVKEFVLLTKSH